MSAAYRVPVSVGIADDHPVVIRGMRQLLASSRYHVVWEAHSKDACLESTRREAPDVILLDLRLGQDLGPDVCRELKSVNASSRIVMLTGHEDLSLLKACLAANARGVLLKDARDLDLVRALDRVMLGELVFDPRVEAQLDPAVIDENARLETPLTEREYDVLRLVARGLNSREIASQLFLSTNTVRSYMQSVLTKLDAHTRIEAIGTARTLRLL